MGEYKVPYKNVGKKQNLEDFYKKLIPTKTFVILFVILFFGCTMLSMMGIPFMSLFSLANKTIEIGFPFTFLRLQGLITTGQQPLLIRGLMLNLLIYAIVSYSINLMINFYIDLIKQLLNKNPKEFAKEIKISKKDLKDQIEVVPGGESTGSTGSSGF